MDTSKIVFNCFSIREGKTLNIIFICFPHSSRRNIVQLLLEHGANPNVTDQNGSTPLHLASWTGDYEIVDMLISNNHLKAEINLKVCLFDFVRKKTQIN